MSVLVPCQYYFNTFGQLSILEINFNFKHTFNNRRKYSVKLLPLIAILRLA